MTQAPEIKPEEYRLSGTDWKVHDRERPQPRVVTPGDLSVREPVTPPSDAIVLFDGSNLDAWQSKKDGGPAAWEILDDKTLRVVPKTGDIQTKQEFGDCQLHMEWSAPTEITGDGQKRGNSGVFMMGLYEVQVLDGFDNETYADGITAAIYGQSPPLVNACCKPGEWHIYDIIWKAPRFDGETLMSPATITVMHNGVVVQNHWELLGRTVPQIPVYDIVAETGPIVLQDHRDLVRFRNIWLREL
jgi:hypothetical protein